MKKIRVLAYILAFYIGSYSLAFSQSEEDYIYNRESFLEPGTVEEEVSQEPTKIKNYPFALGPKIGVILGGSYLVKGGTSLLNYLETQVYLKIYMRNFWIGAGMGINLFLGGTIQKWYNITGPSLGSGVTDNIAVFSEEVESKTVFYLAFNMGYVTELANNVFLFPELYAHVYAFDRYFLNKEWFVIGANLGLGYKF